MRSRVKWPVVVAAVLVLAVVVYGAVSLLGSPEDPHAAAAQTHVVVTTKPATLPWPDYGQGAYGVAGGPVLGTHGVQKPVSTASVAKVITVLCVLAKLPMSATSDGPTITLRHRDVAIYDKYVAEDGSVVPVRAGQRITERSALEAILVPSANNLADSLAIYTFGSLAGYRSYATRYLQAHGLAHTRIGSDASGFLPNTTSTTGDLVRLGGLLMGNSVLAAIVAEQTVHIPDSGTFDNVDTLLGADGIVGIKTGNNDQDLGVFLGAIRVRVGGRSTTIITALAGAQSLPGVLADSRNLLIAAGKLVVPVTIARAGETVGHYVVPGGGQVDAGVRRDVVVTTIRGNAVRATIRLRPIDYDTQAGDVVGTLDIDGSSSESGMVPVVLKTAPNKPGIGYRLLHP